MTKLINDQSDFEQRKHSTGGHREPILIDVAMVLGFLRRRRWTIIVTTCAAMMLGLTYLVVVPPTYTAVASVLIDPQRLDLFRVEGAVHPGALSSSVIESELQILGSTKVAGDAVTSLELTKDPEFVGGLPGTVPVFSTAIKYTRQVSRGMLASLRGNEGPTAERNEFTTAVKQLQSKSEIKRLGLSYAIQVSFTSLDPDKAARVTNALIKAYVEDKLQVKYQASQHAGDWLQDRITELRTRADDADRQVQTFKAEHQIISTGDKKLLGEAQVSELSSQLLSAQVETGTARARLQSIEEISRSGEAQGAVADMLQNELITHLRQQYLQTAKREAEWSTRYGAGHAGTINLRNQMVEFERSMFSELKRLEQVYRSNLEMAQRRERALQESLDRGLGRSIETMQAQVKLRELESIANTYRSLHDTFLQHLTRAVSQQSFPIADARVIAPAVRPDRKSGPNGSIVLPVSMAMGLLLGSAVALARELSDRAVRTPQQLREIAEAECFGVLPKAPHRGGSRPSISADLGLNNLRTIGPPECLLSLALEHPFSRYSETLRAVKVAVDTEAVDEPRKVIGVVSSLAHEGKTVFAANLARLTAQTGARVLLIDCDLRNPTLTRSLGSGENRGLVDVIGGQLEVDEVVQQDSYTGMHFLPASLDRPVLNASELLSSVRMSELLRKARASYDYIILDLPPILPVVDVRAASHLIDGFVMVVEWGKTRAEAVHEALTSFPAARRKLIGTVLNKVSNAEVARYSPYYEG